jgi:hypothetical protein
MNRYDAALVAHWRRSPTARAVGEREGTGLAHNGGTPRRPRTAKTAARKVYHGRFMVESHEVHPSLFHGLLTSGYYDELRRAFHEAQD